MCHLRLFVLKVPLHDVVSMQCRQPSLEGTCQIKLRRLVKEALRMRPSRIVVGEVRQEESLDLLMSLNMLIELPAGFDYTGAQFDRWARTAGFARTELRHLAGPTSAAIAHKG